MKRSHARGFTLFETVVAIAVAVLLGWLLFHVLAQLLLAGRLQAQRDTAQGAIAQLADNITTEEDDAWAIYVPPADVHGISNGDGHEVDFFARDGKQQPYFWAYTYDASSHTLTRYRFSSPGGSATADVTYSGVTAFSAATYPVTALKDSRTPIYSAMYAGANLQSGIVHFYPSMPWIAGGNNITYVHVEASPFKRDLKLVTTTAPTGFTIVLNYTPAPAPSPAVWPPAILFAASGTTISGCSAFPYNVDSNGNLTTVIPGGTQDPYDNSYGVGSDGCWNSESFVVTETGYTSAFSDDNFNSTCFNSTAYLFPGMWSPSTADGPTAVQGFAPGQSPIASCSVIFKDVKANKATSYAAVLFPNPMYAQVNDTETAWTYNCADPLSNGGCRNGGWQGSTSYSYWEDVSTNQGATWTSVGTCGSPTTCAYPAQFVDTEKTCTSDVHGQTTYCGVVSKTSSNKWSPYAPPGASQVQ